ncbi:radical SAM protein [bacterium]|nr:radical SAM protein [bacterium]
MNQRIARWWRQLRRRVNIRRYRADLLAPETVARARPMNLYYEPTAYCNLKCKICYRETADGFADNKHMPDAVFERVAAAYPDALSVLLLGYGEPLILPQLSEHIARCREHELMGMTSTNGILVDDKIIDLFLSGGLSLVNFSLDATTPETYKKVRGSDAFPKILDNFKRLSAEKRRRGLGAPILCVSFCLLSDNLGDYPALPRLAHELGAEHILTQPFEADADFGGHKGLTVDAAELDRMVEAARVESLALGISFWRTPHNQPPDLHPLDVAASPDGWREPPLSGPPRFYCESLWRMMGVKYDGRVFPCCPRLNTIVGDLATQTVDEVWNGPAYRRLRWELLSGNYPKICEKCPERRPFAPEEYFAQQMAWVDDVIALTARTL